MDTIGDAQFRVMCEMWGVDRAIEGANNMGFEPTKEQIEAAREAETATHERWDRYFKALLKPKEQKDG